MKRSKISVEKFSTTDKIPGHRAENADQWWTLINSNSYSSLSLGKNSLKLEYYPVKIILVLIVLMNGRKSSILIFLNFWKKDTFINICSLFLFTLRIKTKSTRKIFFFKKTTLNGCHCIALFIFWAVNISCKQSAHPYFINSPILIKRTQFVIIIERNLNIVVMSYHFYRKTSGIEENDDK